MLVWRWKKTFDLPETLTNVYNNMGLVISSLTGVKCVVAGAPEIKPLRNTVLPKYQ